MVLLLFHPTSKGYEMASKPKTFDSETVALASAPLLVISEMHKVKPGFGKKIAESVEKFVMQKEQSQGRSGTVTYGFDAKGRDYSYAPLGWAGGSTAAVAFPVLI
jgi:hypothetical protein